MKPSQPVVYWREVYDKYPEAWKIFWDWIVSYDEICEHDVEYLENRIQVLGGCDFTEFSHFNRGDLYSFFDQSDIVVAPMYINNPFGSSWVYCINSVQTNDVFESRKDAEQHAFLKAFEILNDNQKLKIS